MRELRRTTVPAFTLGLRFSSGDIMRPAVACPTLAEFERSKCTEEFWRSCPSPPPTSGLAQLTDSHPYFEPFWLPTLPLTLDPSKNTRSSN